MEILLWIVGIVLSIGIARHYYKQSFSKRLSFFLLVDDRPFLRIAPDVLERLKINYTLPPPTPDSAQEISTQVISSIHHLQVIIANTGARAITFVESPTIEIPVNAAVLDATIIHQNPSDLEVSLLRQPWGGKGPQSFFCSVKMMNSGEHFLIKFLFGNVINPADVTVHMIAEDLPRTLKLEPLPSDATKSPMEAIEWSAVWVGVIFLLMGPCASLTASAALTANPFPETKDFFFFVTHLRPIHYEIVVGHVSSVLLTLMGIAFTASIGLKSLFSVRRRVVLPVSFRPGALPKTVS